MSSIVGRLRPIVVQPSSRHTATVIFLHGSGSCGSDMKTWVRDSLGMELAFPHIRFIYPSAPLRPYTANMGMLQAVWFDRIQISPFVPEPEESIKEGCEYVSALIEEELKNGIPSNRIIVGGFSMGGGLALYYGYRHNPDLAGVFALSSFLAQNSIVYEALKKTPCKTPLFQCHGDKDDLVEFSWGKETHERLRDMGVPGEFYDYPNLYHQLNTDEIKKLRDWIEARLPESP